jgi:hypothetical protein
MLSISATTTNLSLSPWEASLLSEEGHGDGSKLPRHASRALEKSDKVMQSRLRTDRVLRRKIIIGACVGSFLFLAMLGFGVGLLAA